MLAERIDEAAAAAQPVEPIAITADLGVQAPFPVEAMGNVARDTVRSIVALVNLPVCIAAQSVLSVISLAVQGHVDVKLPVGGALVRPSSLFFVTVAESGDRKSAADNLAMRGVREYEKELRTAHAEAIGPAHNRQEAWKEAKKQAINSNKAKGVDALTAALNALGPSPQLPPDPVVVVQQGTTQGLMKHIATGRPSLGFMSDEGGTFVGGYQMGEEQRLNTISAFSKLWDGDAIQSIKVGEGTSYIIGRRLTFHLMMQPIVAAKLLNDPVSKGQGFLSRLLVAQPESLAGTRMIENGGQIDPAYLSVIDQFAARVGRVLREPLPITDEGALEPKVLELDADAKRLWIEFHNDIERQTGEGSELQNVRGFVGKLPEQAARLAALLQVFEKGRAVEAICADPMERAITIARFYLSEARRLYGDYLPTQAETDATVLANWVQAQWDEPFLSFRAVQRHGPTQLRRAPASHLRTVFGELVQSDHLAEHQQAETVRGERARKVYRVIGGRSDGTA